MVSRSRSPRPAPRRRPRVALAALAVALAPVMAMVPLPATGVLAQPAPACAQVFGIGQATQSCLRIVNAAINGGPVDVYVGDTAIAQKLAYSQATDYVAVPSGAQRLRVVAAGGALDQAPVDMTQTLSAGSAYQLTVMGLTTTDVAPWLSGVAVDPLAGDQARVRVVHASADTGPIDVSLAGGPTPFAAIPLGSQSGYVIFGVGTVRFQLRLSGTQTLLLTTPDIAIKPGMNYDLYVIGESKAGTLQLVVFTTKVGTVTAGTPETASLITPIVVVGASPVVLTPGPETPQPTPTS
jgi:Domain of unknown function (DUF4397)